MEARVKIKLFKDGRDYRDDVFVGVNGRKYLLQRGVEVSVPLEVAQVLRNSQRQAAKASEYVNRLVSAYKEDGPQK